MPVHACGVALGVGVLIVVSLTVSCGKDQPGTPTPSISPASPGSPTPTVSVSSIVLSGPQTVALGGTTQLTLTAQMSDGTTQDVTRTALWRSSNASRASIDRGLLTGRTVGETTIAVSYTAPNQAPFSRTMAIVVLPDGTFRLLGRVTEPGGLPVSGANVTVAAGIGVGQSVVSDFDGRYRLYGVAGATQIVAKKSAYRDDVHDVAVSAQDQSVDFLLIPGTPIPQLEGSYTLTVSASASCRDALPEEIRVRTYGADITRNGRYLNVRLNGAAFVSSAANHFYGGIDADGKVTFSLDDFYYYYAYVAEMIGTNQLTLSGSVTAQASADVISGSLNGLFDLRTNDTRKTQVGKCSAQDHQFVLRRR